VSREEGERLLGEEPPREPPSESAVGAATSSNPFLSATHSEVGNQVYRNATHERRSPQRAVIEVAAVNTEVVPHDIVR
jgi:hypothetical protein